MAAARTLPPDFLLGCATAAHQVEGGTDNDWSRWAAEDPARIRDRSDASVACDHHRRYRSDIAQLKELHCTAYRFSVEWSRVEPQPGCFDRAALDHYAGMVEQCARLQMEPLVTLLHFTLPRWLADRGGVLCPDAPRFLARFAAACAERFGDRVRWWMTLNEPNVLAFMGYLMGQWPPGERSVRRHFAALAGTLRMHAAAAHALRTVAARHGWDARVSIAHAERPQRPRAGATLLDRLVTVAPQFIFNRWFLRCCSTGRMLPPAGRGQHVPGLRGSLDWLGVNYYTEDTVRFDAHSPHTLFAGQSPDPNAVTSSFGWAIDPAGMRRALLALWRDFALPMLITENGVSDEDDELRPRYLVDHLNAVLDAVDAGADVRGYLHWTAWDNFEWAEGYTKRFGLFAVDRETQERIAKPSARLFAGIGASRSVPAGAP